AFAWQWLSLPAMNNAPSGRARNPFQLLRTPQIAIGMAAIMLLFMGCCWVPAGCSGLT
ncbi:major facilitator family transporter, partial [Pseudomonas syringae pv. actinidiae ICMP 18807]